MDSIREALNLTRPLLSPLVVSDACFDSLVLEWNVFDVACIKAALSKGAGYGIVVFSSVLKLPLIINIVRSQSVAGLSTLSVYLEATMYAAVLVYHRTLGSPFSTYGEKYALLAQNILISALIWIFGRKSMIFMIGSAVMLIGVLAAMINLPKYLSHFLILYSSTGAVVSRVPQITANFINGHTGVLSFATLLMAVVGAFVRLLTVIQEVDDTFAILGETLPLLLNLVILFQIQFYKESTKAYLMKLKKD